MNKLHAYICRKHLLQAARNVVFTNSKSLRDVGLNAAALYSFYSLMNHSCVANSTLSITRDLRYRRWRSSDGLPQLLDESQLCSQLVYD